MLLKDLPVEVLAADYKARMIPSNEIYTWFVRDRDLNPEISAKDLLKVVDSVSPSLLARNISTVWLKEHELTHILTHTNGHKILVKITEKTDKLIKYITQYGGTGSTPMFLVSTLESLR